MNKDKKKYTFEDWLDGSFPDDPLIVLLKVNNRITDETASKIREAQREAWNKALEMTETAFKESAKNEFENVPKPELWLKREIQKIESFINDNPELEQKYASGKVNISDIQGSKYRRIKESYKDFKEGGRHFVGIDRKINGKFQPCQLYRMYVDRGYLAFLKELRDDFDIEEKGTNQKGFTLREMKEIAEKRWKELLADGYSENKAAQKISDEINNQRAPKTIKNWMHPEYS